jgi:hypothetical protein
MEKETEKTNVELEGFDLEIDESAPKAAPRVHVAPGDSACISCEG